MCEYSRFFCKDTPNRAKGVPYSSENARKFADWPKKFAHRGFFDACADKIAAVCGRLCLYKYACAAARFSKKLTSAAAFSQFRESGALPALCAGRKCEEIYIFG